VAGEVAVEFGFNSEGLDEVRNVAAIDPAIGDIAAQSKRPKQ
jgi:hypothetical protein